MATLYDPATAGYGSHCATRHGLRPRSCRLGSPGGRLRTMRDYQTRPVESGSFRHVAAQPQLLTFDCGLSTALRRQLRHKSATRSQSKAPAAPGRRGMAILAMMGCDDVALQRTGTPRRARGHAMACPYDGAYGARPRHVPDTYPGAPTFLSRHHPSRRYSASR